MATSVLYETSAATGSYVDSWRPWMALYGLRLRPATPVASHQARILPVSVSEAAETVLLKYSVRARLLPLDP